MRISKLTYGMALCVLLFSLGGAARGELISYWAFDNNDGLDLSSGSQGDALDVTPGGLLSVMAFPPGETAINRIDIGQTSYQYLKIHNPVSVLSTTTVDLGLFDFRGYSDMQLSFAAYISDLVSVEHYRVAGCYIGGAPVSPESFSVNKTNWALTTIDLPSEINGMNNVRIELKFSDFVDVNDDLHIDNIQLTGVPEPASLSLLTLGAALLIRRRRNK